MNIITSSSNPLVKNIKALKLKKNRDEQGLFVIEGIRFVEEAIKSDANITDLVISEQFLETNDSFLSTADRYPMAVLNEKLLRELADTENPQGIIAVIQQKHHPLAQILIISQPRLLILDSVQDPGNMGTIIRTADAAGFTGVIASQGCVDIYNSKVLRATMGSIFHLPIYQGADLAEVLHAVKLQGIRVYTTHLTAKEDCYSMDFTRDIALVIGNEANGVGSASIEKADALIRIPMLGSAESLNASVAASILIYESVRQRIEQGIK